MIVVPTPQVEPPSGSHCSHETIGKESRLRIAHLQHEPFFGERVVEGTNASWATKGDQQKHRKPAVLPSSHGRFLSIFDQLGFFCTQRVEDGHQATDSSQRSRPSLSLAGDVQQKVAASEAKSPSLDFIRIAI